MKYAAYLDSLIASARLKARRSGARVALACACGSAPFVLARLLRPYLEGREGVFVTMINVVFFAWIFCSWVWILVVWPEWRRERATWLRMRNSVGNREVLLDHIVFGRPYALYLRDFSSERREYTEMVMPASSFTARADTTEFEIIGTVAERMPVFSLGNAGNPEPTNRQSMVYCADDEWQFFARAYSSHAAIVLLNVNALTPALKLEIGHLMNLKRLSSVAIFASTSAEHSLEYSFPGMLEAVGFQQTKRAIEIDQRPYAEPRYTLGRTLEPLQKLVSEAKRTDSRRVRIMRDGKPIDDPNDLWRLVAALAACEPPIEQRLQDVPSIIWLTSGDVCLHTPD
jgi:hypothetical protein